MTSLPFSSSTIVAAAPTEEQPQRVSITPLLKRLVAASPQNDVPAADIALAWARSFENRLSDTQLASLLTLLSITGKDKHPEVIAKCASAMRDAAAEIPVNEIKTILGKRKRELSRGSYRGGLCDIVGTGGDMHSTYNVSTTASIVAAPLLAIAKHGNRSVSSMSGSADLLKSVQPMPPILEAVTPDSLPSAYEQGNYLFLLAPNFHSGMKYAATVRKELGLRTIFNLMGPLANPVDRFIEARVIGVAYQELGGVFADALKQSGYTKAMVVCGLEDLDEISCAGGTNCWWLREKPNPKWRRHEDDTSAEEDNSESLREPQFVSEMDKFELHPRDFGLPTHALSEVGGGKRPAENAKVLQSILGNELDKDDPILHFVLINVAALLVVSGVCDADEDSFGGQVIKERGPGGGRWKEGVRLARYCLESGLARKEFDRFIHLTHQK